MLRKSGKAPAWRTTCNWLVSKLHLPFLRSTCIFECYYIFNFFFLQRPSFIRLCFVLFHSWYKNTSPEPFLSPEAAILFVSTKNRDLWPLPKPEVRDSRTHCQIWQTWLAENYRKNFLRMLRNWDWPEVSVLGADQKDRGLWDENELQLVSLAEALPTNWDERHWERDS